MNKNTHSLVIPVLILIGIGILMVYSSTALISTRKYGSGFHYLWNHLFTIFVGLVAMVFLSRINYQNLRPLTSILLIISLLLLILVFIPGIGLSTHGARRWIRLWPTTFQPSELVKITMVLFLADYMDKNMHRMKDFRYGIMIPVGVMIVFQALILLQPDFGAVMSLGILTIGLLLLGGARLSHIGMLILLSLPTIYILLKIAPYRWERIKCFLDPWQEPFGCGYQLIQSFIAFGRGGILGLGIGGSKQKLFFLPEVHTDFIFSVIGEELGLVGVMAVLGLFLWIFIKGFKIANQTNDAFSYYLVIGLTLMIGSQAIINFAVSTGLIPTKGLPLPFISYGGSALLLNMAAIGVLINISKENEKRKIENGVRRYR
jgi:cell division protein FtsW